LKLKFKINRRHQVYITTFTCAAFLWLMVARFGLTESKLFVYGLVSIFLLLVLLALSALAAKILRFFMDR